MCEEIIQNYPNELYERSLANQQNAISSFEHFECIELLLVL